MSIKTLLLIVCEIIVCELNVGIVSKVSLIHYLYYIELIRFIHKPYYEKYMHIQDEMFENSGKAAVQSTLFLLSARGYISNMVSKGSNI